jgi:tRNA-specific 2-thiouridylase
MAEGYHVVALTIDTMGDEAMLHKARTKAEEIGAEWLMYDAREEFKREIIDYFCQEYAMGHTPAPCTRCNPLIKWRTLLNEANRLGIKHIATGHYFNIERRDERYYVTKGVDESKDQSYYLWGLSQEILSRAITPMGNAIKSDVKQTFKDKSESMGICFLNGLPYAEFLRNRGIDMPDGDILTRNGEVCGRHNGIARYTIGQKRGEGLKDGMRVIDIDASKNRIIVGPATSLYKHTLHINNANIVDINELLTADDITIKIRGIGVNPEQPVSIERWEDGFMIHTPDAAYAPAKGQPLVFYRGERVIGGGIVVGFN